MNHSNMKVPRPDGLICKNCGNSDPEEWCSRGHEWQCKTCGTFITKTLLDNPEGGEYIRYRTEDNVVTKTYTSDLEIKTRQELCERLGIDLEEWTVKHWKCVLNHPYRKDRHGEWIVEDGQTTSGKSYDSGKLLIKSTWNVTVDLVPRAEYVETKEGLNNLLLDIKKSAPKLPKTKYPKFKTGLMLEVDITDLHFGRLTWGKESGADYDVKIAREMALKALDGLLAHAKNYPVSKILFPLGNDFFNVDGMAETTTRGTPQQEDTRWAKTFHLGCQLAIELIEKCRTVAPVDVIVVRGNHAEQREFYLGEVVEAYFSKTSDVHIDNSPKNRKYYQFSKCLIGFTHGYWEKLTQLPSLMAQEAPKMFGDTIHREWHTGDKHHEEKIRQRFLFDIESSEAEGMVVRILRSLASPDLWTYNKGFVGARRAAEAFLWHPEDGLIAHFNALGE